MACGNRIGRGVAESVPRRPQRLESKSMDKYDHNHYNHAILSFSGKSTHKCLSADVNPQVRA